MMLADACVYYFAYAYCLRGFSPPFRRHATLMPFSLRRRRFADDRVAIRLPPRRADMPTDTITLCHAPAFATPYAVTLLMPLECLAPTPPRFFFHYRDIAPPAAFADFTRRYCYCFTPCYYIDAALLPLFRY